MSKEEIVVEQQSTAAKPGAARATKTNATKGRRKNVENNREKKLAKDKAALPGLFQQFFEDVFHEEQLQLAENAIAHFEKTDPEVLDLGRTIRTLVRKLEQSDAKESQQDKLVKFHCLICMSKFIKKHQVSTHLQSLKSHIYSLKKFKADVKRASKLLRKAEAILDALKNSAVDSVPASGIKGQSQLLRFGMALRIATLVKINKGDQTEKIFDIASRLDR